MEDILSRGRWVNVNISRYYTLVPQHYQHFFHKYIFLQTTVVYQNAFRIILGFSSQVAFEYSYCMHDNDSKAN